MRRGLLFLCLLLLSGQSGACSSGEVASGTSRTAADQLNPYFSEGHATCASHADCDTGLCDKGLAFTFHLSAGYCVSFANAHARWQRVLLARSLAAASSRVDGLAEAVLSRVSEEWEYASGGSAREGLGLVLAEMGTAEALDALTEMYDEADGGLRNLLGLLLAEAGRESAIEEVDKASSSSVVRVRMQAAGAAGGLCTPPALGVLADLLGDRHTLVRQAAAQALTACCDSEAIGIVRERLDGLDGEDPAASGDRFIYEKALFDCGAYQ